VSELEEERSEAVSDQEPMESDAAEAVVLDSDDQVTTTEQGDLSPAPEELEQSAGMEILAEVDPAGPGLMDDMKDEPAETEEESEEQEEPQGDDLHAAAADEIGEPEIEIEAVATGDEEELPALAEAEQEEEIERLQEGEQEEDEAEPAAAEEPDDGRHWYVVHCYSGYENKVRHNLEQRIETMGMKNKIFDVVVPTEEEIEVKDGKRRTVERRVFPGYILVQMLMDEDSWYVVRNTPGVTGFVGMGNEPTPLRPEEVSQIVKRMEAEAPRIKVTYKTGQKVRIIDGPFNDFIGTVSDIDMERAKVRVMVSFFGRETPVELDFLQVEKA
jgi:transcriptional antiterminator NusG